MSFKYCMVGCLLALVLIPIYASEQGAKNTHDFNRYTISNVRLSGYSLVADVVFLKLVSPCLFFSGGVFFSQTPVGKQQLGGGTWVTAPCVCKM